MATVRAMPDPVSRAIQAASEVRLKIDSIALTEQQNDSDRKRSAIITKINAAVRHATDKWSVPRLQIPRLWMEVVLPESDGTSRTRWDQFSRVLKRECCNNIQAQELLAAYLERRCVSNETLTVQEVGALWKVAILSGALHEDIVFGWHAGILSAVRIVASVEMSAEKRSALRKKIQPFIKWLQRRDQSTAPPGSSERRSAVSTTYNNINVVHDVKQVADVPKLALGSVSEIPGKMTERARPKPPLKARAAGQTGPRQRKVKPKTAR